MPVQSVRGRLIESVLEGRARKGFPAEVLDRAIDLLSAMDAAVVLDDLRFPPGNRLEKLAGDREGQHSLRINRQWRFCFRWTENGPAEVEMVDYH